jgi:hypothetical protein
MYITGKIIPVDVPGMRGGGERRMMEGMSSSMIYLIYCKNFCKCHNVPHPAQQ